MKVTVCELADNEQAFIEDWNNLSEHVTEHKPDLLLLPEMPFGKWIAAEKNVSHAAKLAFAGKHTRWLSALEQLDAAYTVYSKPVIEGDNYYNTAFIYEKGKGHQKIHSKSFFPEEPFFWEASWFDKEPGEHFGVVEVGDIKIGVLLCTEMWFTEHARRYGKLGADLLLCPRATGMESVAQWTRCGQTLAVISGAFCLSSNRSGYGENNFQWGGQGWLAEPMTGNALGITSPVEKFITVDIDLEKSKTAKDEYPLYVHG
jgi:predicted amidohydrolase